MMRTSFGVEHCPACYLVFHISHAHNPRGGAEFLVIAVSLFHFDVEVLEQGESTSTLAVKCSGSQTSSFTRVCSSMKREPL